MAMPDYADEVDDNYFVTMTDMMVGLLFIFLIMVAFFAYKLSKRVDTNDMVPQQLLVIAHEQRDSLQQELDAQISKNSTLTSELDSVRHELTIVQQKYKAALAENNTLLSNLEKTETDLKVALQNISKLEIMLNEAAKEIKTLENRLLEFSQLKDISAKLLEVTEQRDKLQAELDTLIALRDQLKSEIEILKNKNKNAEKVILSLQDSIAKLNADRSRLEKELQEIRLNSLARFNESSRDSRRRILSAVQKRVTEIDQSIAISADYERGILRLQGVDLFASASTSLLNPNTVRLLASILEKELDCFIFGYQPDRPCEKRIGFVEAVYIEGHTDNLPLRSGRRTDGITNNLQLSARRASNTYQTMIDSAPGLALFQNPSDQSIMSVSAYGEQRPLTENNSREARNRNRRIDIRLEMYQPKDESEIGELEGLSVLKAQTTQQNQTFLPVSPTTRQNNKKNTTARPSPTVTWEVKRAPGK